MRNKAGILFMVLGAVLVAASLFLLLYNRNEDDQAGAAMENILPEMQEVIRIANPTPAYPTSPDTGMAMPPYPDPPGTEMTVVEIEGYGYIGYLTIPSLSLELPVMSEWDYERLKIAPCRYYGSTKSDDLVIVAHNYKKHLGYMYKLRPGEAVIFTDMDGVVSAYAVAEVDTLEPTAVEEMVSGGWDLTLFTCTYGGQSRVTVRCMAMTDAS